MEERKMGRGSTWKEGKLSNRKLPRARGTIEYPTRDKKAKGKNKTRISFLMAVMTKTEGQLVYELALQYLDEDVDDVGRIKLPAFSIGRLGVTWHQRIM